MSTMRLQVLIVAFLSLVLKVWGQAPTPPGVRFIGVGYNLVEGNPEGGTLHNGGVDPGLLTTRPILLLTYDNGRVSSDRQYEVPDEVEFSPRHSCVQQNMISVFSGAKSYQKRLEAAVTTSGNYLSLYSFSASAGFRSVEAASQSNRKVNYQSIEVCNMGRARYRDELARIFRITDGFAADACSLPRAYDQNAYMNFLDDWGTHVVVEVELGTKVVERYQESESAFVRYAMDNVQSSVSFEGSYAGFSSSVSVDIETFNSHMSQGETFGSFAYRFTIGGTGLHEPIHTSVVPMVEMFKSEYWTSKNDFVQRGHCAESFSPLTIKANIERALNGYAQWKSLQPPTDPELKIPITWPSGTYGFPRATSGCPVRVWSTGWRYHDTEDSNPSNQWSNPIHLDSERRSSSMRHSFCMKTLAEEDDYNWSFPPGKYCVYKKGPCPTGLQEGRIHWDDEDNNNRNGREGELPDGTYGRDTDIFFCCRTDGYAAVPIHLPSDRPFFLFLYGQQCQEVHGMSVTREWFRWDTEDSNNNDRSYGSAPTRGPRSLQLTFCYYART